MTLQLPRTRIGAATLITAASAGAAAIAIIAAVRMFGDARTSVVPSPAVQEQKADQSISPIALRPARAFAIHGEDPAPSRSGTVADVDPRNLGIPVIIIGPGRPDQLLTITPYTAEFAQLIGQAGFLTRS